MYIGDRFALVLKLMSWILVAGLLLGAFGCSPARKTELGQFQGQADVGSVKIPGSASYDPATQAYTIHGSGANMWFDRDEFHLVYKRLSGDFVLQTRAHFLGEGLNPHRKLGWIVRTSLDSSSAYADAAVHGSGLTSLQYRRTPGGETEEIQSGVTAPEVIRLARHGDTYIMSVGNSSDSLVSDTLRNLDLGDPVYAGLFVCSHDETVTETAVFREVRITDKARNH